MTTTMQHRRLPGIAWLLMLLALACAAAFHSGTARAAGVDSSFEVMREFTEQGKEVSDIVAITEKRKHQILFFMGVVLLIAIISTAWLGIAMVIFGKQVFVAHMIFAGISVFLSIVHAVTAIVWFFPF